MIPRLALGFAIFAGIGRLLLPYVHSRVQVLAFVFAALAAELVGKPLAGRAPSFAADMKEVVELRYLWERPVRLDNRHLVATLGHEPHTPLADAVRETLAFMKVPVAK